MGRLTGIPFMWVWLKLTIMKLARRKNMMSMSGMISIRARFFGIGEATCIVKTSRRLIGRASHGERDWYFNLGNCARFKSPASERADSRVIQNWVSYTLGHGS